MNNRKNLNIEKETIREKFKNNTKEYKQSKKKNHQERKKERQNELDVLVTAALCGAA
jgi:hypothetical protein